MLLVSFGAARGFAASITVGPGSSPPGGYLPLSLFGIAPIAGVGDDTITNFNVPSFLYAGQEWSSLGVGSNGYVVVGNGGGASFVNTSLPDPTAPNNLLAAFWTDLNPGVAGAIRIGTLTDGADTWIVVDWDHVRNFSDPTTNTFEIWIGLTGDAHPGEDITFTYGPHGNGDGGFLTIGAEDITGTIGATYYFRGAGAPIGTLPQGDLRVTTRGFETPEPATLLLALTGLAPAAARRLRRRRSI
jgi:hypothetical protein